MSQNDVVISGIGAYCPQSPSIQNFANNLLANRDLTEPTNRWKFDIQLGVQPICGQIPFDQFDETFYGVNKKLARNMDPVSKIAYQRSFEAILDAGLHPASMRGKNIAVFAGGSINEFEQKAIIHGDNATRMEGYSIMGIARSMLANRISYFFDFKGSSCALDSSWTVAHLGLRQAVAAIQEGSSEAALVVAAGIARFAHTSALLKDLGFISEDGKTRSFDEDGSGSVRSDCAVAFFLQRAQDAKRYYAKVVATGIDFVGVNENPSITLFQPRGIERFFTNFYRQYSIDPKKIAYLEADGSGNPLRDEIELNAIDALVKESDRHVPLLIGSVKGNVGLTDSAAGFVSISKAIVAMETGIIPATLNFNKPVPGALGVSDGRLQIVDQNTPLSLSDESVVAVTTLGLSSTVGHTVLQPNPRKEEAPQEPSEHLPRLITLSARTEEGLRDVIAKIKAEPFNTNYYRLVQDVFSATIRGYIYRSYVICPPPQNEEPQVMQGENRTLWFVYSGMGSQWAGMGTALMRLPIFADTIDRLHAILLRKSVDLKTILSETGPEAFDDILKSFVGITACQIALTNVLTAVGLIPDGIIGHSVGELGCAYADGCLTEEQAILAAWARGVASNEATLIKGKMAAIGLSSKDVTPRLPSTIDVACHNSDTSCTLSGPAEDVERFVKQLTDEGVFARAVNVSDIAYHSRYIQPAAPFLRKYLQDVIPDPKPRSSRWITTSVPIHQRDAEWAKYCSAEYQTNNLLSPVLFEESLAYIPKQSVVIEVAPHGLLQAILKRALPDPVHIPLTQRGHADPLHFLLGAIGKTSFFNLDPRVARLYPEVEFPVPRGTPCIGRLATHLADASTHCDQFKALEEWPNSSMDLCHDSPFLDANGTRLCPLSENLMLMWLSIVRKVNLPVGTFPISFRDVLVEQWKSIPSNGVEEVWTEYMFGTSQAEVIHSSEDSEIQIVVRGHVTEQQNDHEVPPSLPPLNIKDQDVLTLCKEELYRDLAASGLRYSPKYQHINSIQISDEDWLIRITHDDWVTTIESILQVYMLQAMEKFHEARLPRHIQRLDIDPSKIKPNDELVLRIHLASGVLEGPGIYVCGFAPAEAPFKPPSAAKPMSVQLVPLGETKCQSVQEFLRMTVQSVLQPGKADLTLMELPNGRKTSDLSAALIRAIHAATGIKARMVTLTPEGTNPPGFKGRVPLVVTGPDTITEAACALAVGVAEALLVWSNERLGGPDGAAASSGLTVLAEQRLQHDWISLVRRASPLPESDALVVELTEGQRVPDVVPTDKTIVLVWRGISEDAVQAAIDEAQARPFSAQARLVFILDDDAPAFSLNEKFYADQLARDVRTNLVLPGGQWGSWISSPVQKQISPSLSTPSLDGLRVEYVGVNPLDLSHGGSLSGHVDIVGTTATRHETRSKAKAGRVMGIGQWLSDNQPPKLDPLLRWPVPQSWSAQDAATVPYVYSLVYYSLKVKAEARCGESILVHEGASAIGQAAIRVATQLGCSPIYTTARNDKERDVVKEIFPQIASNHVLACGDGTFEPRLRQLTNGKGVRLVVNTLPDSELKASMRCLGFWGRLLHFKREDMLAARTIGSQVFLQSTSIFGFSGSELFRASARDRTEVIESVTQGLLDGTVKPIVGAAMVDTSNSLPIHEDSVKTVIKLEPSSATAGQQCDQDRTFLVVGSNASDTLLVAARLSLLGARHILAAVGSSPSSAVIRQRQRALRRQHGTHLHVHQVRDWDSSGVAGVLKAAATMAPVHAAVVVTKDDADMAIPTLVSSALSSSPEVGLVLLAERAGAARKLSALAEQRNALGCRTACLVAPLSEAVDHLVRLLSAPASIDAPAVTVLPSAVTSSTVAGSHPGDCLPRDPAGLASLARTLDEAAVRCADAPLLHTLPSLGPSRANRENFPLFVLPPLGVLDSASRDELTGFAARLFCPVFVVETAAQSSLKATATAVVQALTARYPHGPYNLLGWRLSTVLALEVQRQLEAVGKLGVLFLVHGDVGQVQQWAAQEVAKDGGSRLGSKALGTLLTSIAQHQPNLKAAFQWHVSVIRSSVDDHLSFDEKDLHLRVRTFSELKLDTPALAECVNGQSSWSHLGGYDDLKLAVNRN